MDNIPVCIDEYAVNIRLVDPRRLPRCDLNWISKWSGIVAFDCRGLGDEVGPIESQMLELARQMAGSGMLQALFLLGRSDTIQLAIIDASPTVSEVPLTTFLEFDGSLSWFEDMCDSLADGNRWPRDLMGFIAVVGVDGALFDVPEESISQLKQVGYSVHIPEV